MAVKTVLKMRFMLSIALFLIVWPASDLAYAQEKKRSNKEKKIQEFEATLGLLEQGNYEFIANWAYTNLGYRINLLTNPNHLKMEDGIATIRLPFYGDINTPNVMLNQAGGLVFEGEVENLSIEANEKKREIFVRFQAKVSTEVLEFTLKVFPNGNSSLRVISNQRSRINYDGKTRPLKPSS